MRQLISHMPFQWNKSRLVTDRWGLKIIYFFKSLQNSLKQGTRELYEGVTVRKVPLSTLNTLWTLPGLDMWDFNVYTSKHLVNNVSKYYTAVESAMRSLLKANTFFPFFAASLAGTGLVAPRRSDIDFWYYIYFSKVILIFPKSFIAIMCKARNWKCVSSPISLRSSEWKESIWTLWTLEMTNIQVWFGWTLRQLNCPGHVERLFLKGSPLYVRLQCADKNCERLKAINLKSFWSFWGAQWWLSHAEEVGFSVWKMFKITIVSLDKKHKRVFRLW